MRARGPRSRWCGYFRTNPLVSDQSGRFPPVAVTPAARAARGLNQGMSGFRPRLAPTLFTIAVVLVCALLGAWQLQRLEWKRALIAQREAAVAAAPVTPPQTLGDASGREFHPIIDEG